MDLGNNLKTLRKSKNLTQEELAECLNLSPQTISKWENNLSMPDISMLPILADYFGISVDSLLSYNVKEREADKKELAQRIHALVNGGNTELAYNELNNSMCKWSLSASMNHLMAWVAYTLSKDKETEARQSLLEEAIMYADRSISLDGGETSKTAQAKMTKCFCLVDLDRKAEAVKIANLLPSMYTSRERVLAKITEGSEQKKNIDTMLQFIEELKDEMNTLLK
ncbi:MAG: helix-turn-helix transcriptional regulator [Lachnospiraceae bacterium]|nr:helix-turn-helix transcriptional regulator [Lachnospiraceae bacterium]